MVCKIGGIIFNPADNAGRMEFAMLSTYGISGTTTSSPSTLRMFTNGGTIVVAMVPMIRESGGSAVVAILSRVPPTGPAMDPNCPITSISGGIAFFARLMIAGAPEEIPILIVSTIPISTGSICGQDVSNVFVRSVNTGANRSAASARKFCQIPFRLLIPFAYPSCSFAAIC